MCVERFRAVFSSIPPPGGALLRKKIRSSATGAERMNAAGTERTLRVRAERPSGRVRILMTVPGDVRYYPRVYAIDARIVCACSAFRASLRHVDFCRRMDAQRADLI